MDAVNIPRISTSIYLDKEEDVFVLYCSINLIFRIHHLDQVEFRYINLKLQEQPVGQNAEPFRVHLNGIYMGMMSHHHSGVLQNGYCETTVNKISDLISEVIFDDNINPGGQFNWENSVTNYVEIENQWPPILEIWMKLRDNALAKVSNGGE